MRKIIFAFLAAALMSIPASAQRTAPGQWGVSVSYPVLPGQGLTIGALQYTELGYWDVNLGAAYWGEYTSGASALDNSNVGHWAALGGYMFRFASSRDRAFCAYIGADGILGYEKIQRWFSSSKEAVDGVENASDLSFGFLPKAEAEVFLAERFALTADAGLILNINSAKAKCRPVVSLGARYCF